MTALDLPALAAALVAGAGTGAAVAYRVLTVRYDLHGYRQLRVHDARVRQAYVDADHEHRLALRWERRADEARAEIGELVLALADRDRRLADARARARRRSPVPAYGAHRPAHRRASHG
jgi:hypothetical protein